MGTGGQEAQSQGRPGARDEGGDRDDGQQARAAPDRSPPACRSGRPPRRAARPPSRCTSRSTAARAGPRRATSATRPPGQPDRGRPAGRERRHRRRRERVAGEHEPTQQARRRAVSGMRLRVEIGAWACGPCLPGCAPAAQSREAGPSARRCRRPDGAPGRDLRTVAVGALAAQRPAQPHVLLGAAQQRAEITLVPRHERGGADAHPRRPHLGRQRRRLGQRGMHAPLELERRRPGAGPDDDELVAGPAATTSVVRTATARAAASARSTSSPAAAPAAR